MLGRVWMALRMIVRIASRSAPTSGKRGARTTRNAQDSIYRNGGKKSLLENSTNICRGKHGAKVKMKGHNGAVHNFTAPLKAHCGKGKKSHRWGGR